MNYSDRNANLARAILQSIAYADIFDYPLNAAEIHRYLIGVEATRGEVEQVLRSIQALSQSGDYFTLRGREALTDLRRQRERWADELWLHARGIGKTIASLPFIRMVAVTGSLAMRNADKSSDIDYLIITEPGRLWFCRGMVLLIGRLAALRGTRLCPNYMISLNTLVFQDKTLYTAHEIAQMVPLSGLDVYHLLIQQNDWIFSYLPNAQGVPFQDQPFMKPIPEFLAHPKIEALLRTAPFSLLERWEMDRKIRQLTREQGSSPESSFSPDICKGHAHLHQAHTKVALMERMSRLQNDFYL